MSSLIPSWLSGGGSLLVLPKWTARKAGAYLLGDLPEKDKAFEGDTLMCKHCQFHWVVKPNSGIQRGWCYSCKGPLCARSKRCDHSCGGNLHFMREVENMERKGRWFESLGIGR